MNTLRKFLIGTVAIICIIFIVFMAIPLPSYQRSVVITNRLSVTIEVKCVTADRKREKTFHLSPEAHEKFVYFAGDHGITNKTLVVIEAKISSKNILVEKKIELPTDNQPQGIDVTKEWFEPISKP